MLPGPLPSALRSHPCSGSERCEAKGAKLVTGDEFGHSSQVAILSHRPSPEPISQAMRQMPYEEFLRSAYWKDFKVFVRDVHYARPHNPLFVIHSRRDTAEDLISLPEITELPAGALATLGKVGRLDGRRCSRHASARP